MNQIVQTIAQKNTGNIPGLKQGDAKNAPLLTIPGIEVVDLVGLSWIFSDHNYHPFRLAYPERRCNVIE